MEQLKANGFPQAAVYDPPGVGGTSVVTVLAFGDQPELYGLPANPTVPRAVTFWKGRVQDDRQFAMSAGIFAAAVHFVGSDASTRKASLTDEGSIDRCDTNFLNG